MMKSKSRTLLYRSLLFLVVGTLLLNLQSQPLASQTVMASSADTACRFGITSPTGSEGYDIASIGVGSYLDWGAGSAPALPDGVAYVRVLRLRDDLYPQTLSSLPTQLQAYPGSVWVVGNEPDTTYGGQDALLPEEYADRYYEVATIIRQSDPSARIGFGSIVQPTPIRMRYLDRAWEHLVTLTGNSSDAASDLIDIWSIHSFILNEKPDWWGTGVPPGFEGDPDYETIAPDQTFSITIFEQRLIDFRLWMAAKGERDKPLWITEYGSLMPPIDPPDGPDYYNVSDEETANFMLATFNFMLGAVDATSGLPTDENRLVQRWFWYSLNDHRYNFGGSVYDPDNEKTLTTVGQAFRDYQALDRAQPDLFPVSLSLFPFSYAADRTRVNYRLYIDVRNASFADTGSDAYVWIYDGVPQEGTLIAGPLQSGLIQRCGGSIMVAVNWLGIQPLTGHTLYVLVVPIGVEDSDPDNNLESFSVFTALPDVVYLPSVFR